MNVGELRKKLEGWPSGMRVILEGCDCSRDVKQLKSKKTYGEKEDEK